MSTKDWKKAQANREEIQKLVMVGLMDQLLLAALTHEMEEIDALLEHAKTCPNCSKRDQTPLWEVRAKCQTSLAKLGKVTEERERRIMELSHAEGLLAQA